MITRVGINGVRLPGLPVIANIIIIQSVAIADTSSQLFGQYIARIVYQVRHDAADSIITRPTKSTGNDGCLTGRSQSWRDSERE